MISKIFKPVMLAGALTLMLSACTTENATEEGEVASISKPFVQDAKVVADFLIDSKPVALKVRFSSTSEGASSYKWSFPNGTPSTSTDEVPPIVKYEGPGEYTATLEVSDGNSTDTHSSTFQL